MEATRLTYSLRPSPLTMLRRRLDLDLVPAARYIGLTPVQLRYLEEHTRRLAPGTLSTIALVLDPPTAATTQTFWQWLSDTEHEASEKRGQA